MPIRPSLILPCYCSLTDPRRECACCGLMFSPARRVNGGRVIPFIDWTGVFVCSACGYERYARCLCGRNWSNHWPIKYQIHRAVSRAAYNGFLMLVPTTCDEPVCLAMRNHFTTKKNGPGAHAAKRKFQECILEGQIEWAQISILVNILENSLLLSSKKKGAASRILACSPSMNS